MKKLAFRLTPTLVAGFLSVRPSTMQEQCATHPAAGSLLVPGTPQVLAVKDLPQPPQRHIWPPSDMWPLLVSGVRTRTWGNLSGTHP